MIRKKAVQAQATFWISTDELQVKPQISFYTKLNEVLDSIDLGNKIRTLCEPYYSEKSNCRPPIDPEIYFKMLMVGFFENITSERGIASRCADSLSIRAFLGYSLIESTPNHSTLSIIRHRLPATIFDGLFTIILKGLISKGLVKGKNIAWDSSIIEANASLRSLQNRMTEESYAEYIQKLAKESGINPDDKAAVARFDRTRKDRKTSNKDWHNPHDPDAKVGQTKDGATDMVYKPEHAVDLDTGAIVDADILLGDRADSHLFSERIVSAQIRLNDASDDPITAEQIESATTDKGYFKAGEVVIIESFEITPVMPDREINRTISKLSDEEASAVEVARVAVKSKEGKALLKRRGMYVERSFAHVLDCGGQRKTTLRGVEDIRKRYLVATACFNLSLLMRTLFGLGTPKQFLLFLNFVRMVVYACYYAVKKQISSFSSMTFLESPSKVGEQNFRIV
ncbi:MAG: transposase [Ignavibacteria bacterium]|nr:transposase [Ignavibacteria bacterium]